MEQHKRVSESLDIKVMIYEILSTTIHMHMIHSALPRRRRCCIILHTVIVANRKYVKQIQSVIYINK